MARIQRCDLLRVGNRNPVAAYARLPTGDDQSPAFSPDGERIAFRSSREGGGIFLMTASGESVTRLTDTGFSPSWSPDGKEIVVSPAAFKNPANISAFGSGLSVVDVQSGRVRTLPTKEKALQPAWSPHGSRLASWGSPRKQRAARHLDHRGRRLGSRTRRRSSDNRSGARLESGVGARREGCLYFSSTRGGILNLWRVAIDERSGRVLGGPGTSHGADGLERLSVVFSRDGTRLAFASLDYRSTLFRVPFDAAKAATATRRADRQGHPANPRSRALARRRVGRVHVGRDRKRICSSRESTALRDRRLTDDPFRDRGPSVGARWVAPRVLFRPVRHRTTSGRYARTAARLAPAHAGHRHRRLPRLGA